MGTLQNIKKIIVSMEDAQNDPDRNPHMQKGIYIGKKVTFLLEKHCLNCVNKKIKILSTISC